LVSNAALAAAVAEAGYAADLAAAVIVAPVQRQGFVARLLRAVR
jgi:hypothetical protein